MCESVLTHTRPCPPPGAAVVFVAAPVLVAFAEGMFAGAGLAAAEVFGLNKSPRLNFAGDADAATLAAGLAAALVCAFFRPRLAFGEAAGDSAAEAVVAV